MLCKSCYHGIPDGSLFCPRCGARQADRPPAAGPPALPAEQVQPSGAPEPERWENPWEDRAGRGFFAALGETLQRSLFHPAEFFRRTAPDRNVGSALWYAVVVGTFSLGVLMLWQRAMGTHVAWMLGGRFQDLEPPVIGGGGSIVWVPLAVLVEVVVSSAVFHVGLRLVGAGGSGFGATVKATAYACSALAFNVFPACGTAVFPVWFAVVQVIGFRELHRTTSGRALLGWVLPFLVVAALAMAAAVLMGVGLMRLMHEFGGRFDV